MEKQNYDLSTRVENKPEDCGKRVSYNELVFGNNYYVLYNQKLHKVQVEKMITHENAPALKIAYLEEEQQYLGERCQEEEKVYYLINLEQYYPLFYEVKFSFQ